MPLMTSSVSLRRRPSRTTSTRRPSCRDLLGVGMEELLDGGVEEAGQADGQRERWQVPAGLDRVDGLARDAQRGGESSLGELAGAAKEADVVAHCQGSFTCLTRRCQVSLTG